MSSSIAKFQLIRLPDIPRNQILRELDAFDIIQLSLLSQKMKRIVRSWNYPIEDVNFYAHEKRCRTKEKYNYDPYATAIMIVNSSTKVEVIDSQPEDKQRFKVLGGMEITCESDSCGDKTVNFICPAGAERKSIREFAHRHFLEVFQKIGNINLYFVSGNLTELYLWNYTKSVHSIYFAGNTLERISEEDMKFALEEVETSSLKIWNPVQKGFRFSAGFKAQDVVIGVNSSWVELDAVINSISSYIYLTRHRVKITRSQINNLLKLWISGERMANLTCFIVNNCRIIGEGEDVFDGIEIQSYKDEDTCIVARYNGQLARIAIGDDEFSFTVKG